MTAPSPSPVLRWTAPRAAFVERRARRFEVALGLWSAAIVTIALLLSGVAYGDEVCDNSGRGVCQAIKQAPAKHHRTHAHRSRPTLDASGNVATVRSRSGVHVRVSPSARAALQCVVDHVEAAGVRIKAMRGYGPGTVRASLHPSGRAIDINQTARDVTRPHVPRSVSNAAADACGVISGARWGYADNGHWNLTQVGQPKEPWPRVVSSPVTP